METKGIDLTKCNNCWAIVRARGIRGREYEITGWIKTLEEGTMLLVEQDEATTLLWHNGEMDDHIIDLKIVPRDPETYRDWQVGDKVCEDEHRNASYEVIFRSGELVVFKDWNNWASNPMTCSEAFTRFGMRLVLTDIEQQIIEEKTKYEPQDGDVCFVRTDAGNCFIFIKRDHKPDEGIHSYACFDTNLWCLCSTKVSCVCDRKSIRELRPATDEEKQLLFDAMAKKGKRWNAEKKVVEDIPKPYEVKKGEPVLVRDNDENIWILSSFIQFIPTSCFHVTNGVRPSHWKQCIPYNEKTMHLLGTTEDYKEE